jgi:hypothetical protein
MELDGYRDALEFDFECKLTSEPLRIDCIVIKKAENVTIRKNIAAVFKEWNIFEYKSPSDYVSVADFYKVYAYACLCVSIKNVPITDMTISFVGSRHSTKLLEHLRKERGYTVAKTAGGIYTVSGDVMPIQVIESHRLQAEENVWLKSLRAGLNETEWDRINTEIARQGKDARIAAYHEVLIKANPEIIQEIFMSKKTSLTLEQVLENVGLTAKWKAEGKAEGVFAVAQNMVNMGLPFETVVSATQLEPEKVKALYRGRSL